MNCVNITEIRFMTLKDTEKIFINTGVQTVKHILLPVSTEYIALAQSNLHHNVYQNHSCYPSWE